MLLANEVFLLVQLSDLEGLDQVAAADAITDEDGKKREGEDGEERLVKKVVELKVCVLLLCTCMCTCTLNLHMCIQFAIQVHNYTRTCAWSWECR